MQLLPGSDSSLDTIIQYSAYKTIMKTVYDGKSVTYGRVPLLILLARQIASELLEDHENMFLRWCRIHT